MANRSSMICLCHFVAEPKIKSVLKKHPHATLDDIKELTYAGTGCGRCVPLLKKIIEDHQAEHQDPQGRLF